LRGIWPAWAVSQQLPRENVPRKLEAIIVSDSTFLLRIPDFDISYKPPLDSLLSHYDKELRKHPNLIIDVRWNSGGSDATFSGLIPYLYTKPIKQYGAEVLCTVDNFNAWDRVKKLIPKSETGVQDQIASIMTLMQAHIGGFATFVADSVITLPAVSKLPVNVAIIINERCASSCEEFLFTAHQSDKVKLFGRHTAGVLDYSNVLEFTLPSGQILHLPCTRSNRLPSNPIDGIGIQPDIVLNESLNENSDSDEELKLVMRYLEKGK
jgi:C-terminal processing protease CtpA/Prc